MLIPPTEGGDDIHPLEGKVVDDVAKQPVERVIAAIEERHAIVLGLGGNGGLFFPDDNPPLFDGVGVETLQGIPLGTNPFPTLTTRGTLYKGYVLVPLDLTPICRETTVCDNPGGGRDRCSTWLNA